MTISKLKLLHIHRVAKRQAQKILSFSSLDTKVVQKSNLAIGLLYTGCNRRNVRDFGRLFLMLNYTDITQNTYIQS